MLAQKRRVRSPVGAGMFYPEDRLELLNKIKSFGLEKGQIPGEQNKHGIGVRAIIAPHGAWGYSGQLTADVFSSAMTGNSIKRVVILGPIHDKREKGLFLSNSHSFNTPIGDILVDHEITEELEFSGESFEINDIPHLGEHSIEILLPFVKYCFPNASIVPILMGRPGAQYIYDLAQALKTVITPIINETLIVVSCNLSTNKDDKLAHLFARECLNLFSEKNAAALTGAILEGRLNACGGALVVSLIESGLLDGTTASHKSSLVSACSSENNITYYGSLLYHA